MIGSARRKSVHLFSLLLLIPNVVCVVTVPSSQPTSVSAPDTYPGNLRQQTNAALKNLRKLQAANSATQRKPNHLNWAPIGETIIVTQAQWADFENSLGLGQRQSGPVWYLLEAVIRFLGLSTSIESTGLLIQNTLYENGEGDAIDIWDQYLGAFSDTIEPLDNHLWDPKDPEVKSQTARSFVDDIVAKEAPDKQERIFQMLLKSQLTPGLMNRGGTLDPGNVREPNLLSMKVLLRRLFDYTVDPGHADEIFLNSGPFLQAWGLTYNIMAKLSSFETKAGVLADAAREVFLPEDANDEEVWHPITDPYPVGLYKRQDIGYDEYFNLKYEGTTRPMGSDEELSQRWGMEASHLEIANMIASYRNQLDGLIKGLFPFMMDMLADIGVKAHDLSKNSRWQRKNWPLLDIEGLDTSIELLRKYPEWSEGQYETGTNFLPHYPDWMERRMRLSGILDL
ncbi:hypothetical protein TWF718_000112 [Orbilia javanica]|uniref:Uncharacterized protein n=1 Tax=Orbilia javanica TaxID=47235 RepID=A0AAN8NA45_9PEZI